MAESLFLGIAPAKQQKLNARPYASAAPIRPRHLVPTTTSGNGT
ncbi:hypothetical protein [Bathymodiolus japonicus methanotrophic gill symbiont]|nr:hypothetical protein [Bathymodiolus japonicus methanotrophic gill symbiont]